MVQTILMIAIGSTTAPALSRPWGFPVYKAYIVKAVVKIVKTPSKATSSDGVSLMGVTS